VVTDLKPIIGRWKLTDSLFVRFDDDGIFRGAEHLDELDSNPYQTSTCVFEDGTLVIKDLIVSGVPSCGSEAGRYELRLLGSGDLEIVLIRDKCAGRAGDTAGLYVRVP
jgi:hypothetical protein